MLSRQSVHSGLIALSFKVLVEPCQTAAPGVFGSIRSVTGPVVSKKSMRRTRIEHELCCLAGCLELSLHFPDISCRDTQISLAIKTKNGRGDLCSNIQRSNSTDLRLSFRPELSVPCHGSLHFTVMGRVKKGIHPATAKSGDA